MDTDEEGRVSRASREAAKEEGMDLGLKRGSENLRLPALAKVIDRLQ